MIKWLASILLLVLLLWHTQQAHAGPWDTEDWEMPVFENSIVLHIWPTEEIHDFIVAQSGPPAEGMTYVGAMRMIYDDRNVGTCHIYVPPLDTSDFAVEIWRHEIRHCTGWTHPEFEDIPEAIEEGLRVILRPGLPKLTLPPDDAVPGMY
ncbi:MAG: hypothetical protein ACXABY_34615 [Candidatus Thorarchaeota archaeon]|jgi:hypothetical protein